MNNNINNNMNNNLNNNINNNQIPDLNNNVVENNDIEDKEFEAKRKKRILIMSILGSFIITVSIIVIAMSGSYAYFVNEVEHNTEHIPNEKVTLSSGSLKMSFGEGGTAINWQKAGLVEAIEDSNDTITATKDNIGIKKEVLDSSAGAAGYSSFTIKFDDTSTVKNAKYDLFLTDLSITKNFKSKYLKWALYSTTSGAESSDTLVAFGDFSNVECQDTSCDTVEDNKQKLSMKDIEILSEASLTNGASVSYKLYIWLENSKTENQVSLLEGQLSVRVGFRAVSSTNTAP